jgi:hypothetical protein
VLNSVTSQKVYNSLITLPWFFFDPSLRNFAAFIMFLCFLNL